MTELDAYCAMLDRIGIPHRRWTEDGSIVVDVFAPDGDPAPETVSAVTGSRGASFSHIFDHDGRLTGVDVSYE